MQSVKNIFLLLLIGFGSAGCYFTSENPLPMKPEVDKALLGAWQVLDEKQHATDSYAIFVADQEGWMQINLMEKEYQNGETYRGFCSEVQGEKYLNVKKVNFGKDSLPEMDKNYYLLHYRIVNQKKLELSMLNEKIFRQALETKKLTGTLSKPGDELTLASPANQLVEFIQQHSHQELLDKPMPIMEKTNRLPATE